MDGFQRAVGVRQRVPPHKKKLNQRRHSIETGTRFSKTRATIENQCGRYHRRHRPGRSLVDGCAFILAWRLLVRCWWSLMTRLVCCSVGPVVKFLFSYFFSIFASYRPLGFRSSVSFTLFFSFFLLLVLFEGSDWFRCSVLITLYPGCY